jgi:hypothetical protein
VEADTNSGTIGTAVASPRAQPLADTAEPERAGTLREALAAELAEEAATLGPQLGHDAAFTSSLGSLSYGP